MNQYEIANLRILLKSASMLKVSHIVNGFPDDLQEEARIAISNLVGLGYLSTVETLPSDEVYFSLKKEKRREVLNIVSPHMISHSSTEEDAQQQQQKPTTTKTTTGGSKAQSDSSAVGAGTTTRSYPRLLSTSSMTTLMLVGIIGVCAAAVAIISVFAIYQMSSSSHQMIPATVVEPWPSPDVELMIEEPPLSIVRENGTSIEKPSDLGEVIPAIIPAVVAAVI